MFERREGNHSSRPWTVLLILPLSTFFLYKLYLHIRLRQQRIAFIKEHGCKRARNSPADVFGIGTLVSQTRNVLSSNFAQSVRKSFDDYGTTWTGRVLHRKFIATVDPANLETVMKTNFEDYTIIPGRGKLIRVLFGDGVFSTDGNEWKHSRMLVRSGLSNFSYEPERFEVHARAFLARLREHDHERIDFVKPVFAYTIDAATDILFGESTNTQTVIQENSPGRQFARDFEFLGRMARVLTIMIMQIPFLATIMFGREYYKAQARVFAHVDTCIDKALQDQTVRKMPGHRLEEDKVPRYTVVDGLASRSRDIVRIRSELLNLLLAGHDTVGIALSELFYCLARKPEVWRKLRVEAATVLCGRLPTQSELKSMTYLSWTINEGIRVRPTLSVHARRAVCDTVLPRGGGPDGDEPLFVHTGEYVVYSNYALYQNPKVFGDDVDDFRPERWETSKPRTFEYLNFGAGPRFCPGKEMGWTMLAYIVVRLAQEVEILTPMDDRPWQEAKAFSFHNRHGVHLAVSMAEKS